MLECFRIFADLVESGSFSRAAAANYLTQSAVSQRIQHLENELGQELLVRGHGTVTPTEAGRAFYKTSVEILDSFEHTVTEIQSMQDVVAGRVRVGAVNSIGLYELPPYVEIYLGRYPEVDLDVEFLHSNEIHVRVLESTLDLGLVAFPTRNPQINVSVFRYDDLVVVLSPRHRLADRREVEVKQLAEETLVTFEAGNPTRKAVERRLLRDRARTNLVHQYDNVETVKQAVKMGAGIAVLPLPAVQKELDAKKLVALRLIGEPWQRPLAILQRKGRPMSDPAQRFVEVLQREV